MAIVVATVFFLALLIDETFAQITTRKGRGEGCFHGHLDLHRLTNSGGKFSLHYLLPYSKETAAGHCCCSFRGYHASNFATP